MCQWSQKKSYQNYYQTVIYKVAKPKKLLHSFLEDDHWWKLLLQRYIVWE